MTESADHPMSFLLSEDFEFDFPKVGDIREGHVVAHRKSEILIDIGAKSEGIIAGTELESMDSSTRERLAVGKSVSVYVVDPEDKNGNIILSYAKVIEEEDWLEAEKRLEDRSACTCEVIGYNKGGLLVSLGQLRGFIPASQLGARRRTGNRTASIDERFSKLVGEEITSRVIEVDRSRNRLILSERAAMKEIRAAERARLMQELEAGEVREGRVVNLADFGAFVDIGGLEGLVHLSELSWKRVDHPSDILDVGAEISVYILSVDHERGRVALSMKRLEPDPWTMVNEFYNEGELVEATVTKLTKYGAFARVNDDYELEGLIHISELANERIEHPQDVVQRGQLVAARIIRIDSDQRQLGLSLKQVSSAEYLEKDLAMAEDIDTE